MIRQIEPPDDTLIVTADALDYVYQRTDSGDDLLGLLIRDPQLGALFVALSVEQATDIAAQLQGMVSNLGTVRAEWEKRHP